MIESTKRPLPGEPLPTVYVVEDDISVRESLGRLIREVGWVPQLFGTAREFLGHPIVDAPRCLVLDMTLPDLSGLDLQQRLSDGEKMPIIFITGAVNVPMTVQAMKAGAFEFLSKPFDTEALISAVTQALKCSSAALRRQRELSALQQAYALLTVRERAVMHLVVSGRLNKQIASELGISELTVKGHRGRVMRKMKVESVAALVRIDAQLRQVPPAQRTADWRPIGSEEPVEVSPLRWRAM
jgi:FixJ family two-component response regulator